MTSEATAGFGTLLQMHDGAEPGSFTTIAEVRDINLGSEETSEYDVTNHSSTSFPYQEFIPGFINAGEATFEINFLPGDPTQDHVTGLRYVQQNRLTRQFRTVLTDADDTTITFSAFVRRFEILAPVDGVLRANVTLRRTGSAATTSSGS